MRVVQTLQATQRAGTESFDMSTAYDSLTLAELRTRVSALGLDTATPGLSGADRHEELLHRLMQAEGVGRRRGTPGARPIAETDNKEFAVPSLNALPIAEIRDRLTALGENTATPGITGEARRQELMRRLVSSICISDPDDEMLVDLVSISSQQQQGVREEEDHELELEEKNVKTEVIVVPATATTAPKFKPVPPPPPKKPQPALPAETLPVVMESVRPKQTQQQPDRPVPTQKEITEMKRELKRISNKRALYVAAKLSGTNQDAALRESEKLTTWTDAEMARLRQQKQKSKTPATERGSSMLIEEGILMNIDKVIAKLDELRNEAKEHTRVHRLRIRAEADGHPEFGTVVEERIKSSLSEAAINKGLSLGRVNHRSEEQPEASSKAAAVAKATAEEKSASLSHSKRPFSADSGNDDEDDAEDLKFSSAFPSVGSSATRNSKAVGKALAPIQQKGKAPGQQQAKGKQTNDMFDARFSSLEAQGDEQMRGLEDLLAEMEMEEEQARLELELENEKREKQQAKDEDIETWHVNPPAKEIKVKYDQPPPPLSSRPPSSGSSRPNSSDSKRSINSSKSNREQRQPLVLSADPETVKLAMISLTGRPPPPSSPPAELPTLPGGLPLINNRDPRNVMPSVAKRSTQPELAQEEDDEEDDDDEEMRTLRAKYQQQKPRANSTFDDDEDEDEDEYDEQDEGEEGEEEAEEGEDGVASAPIPASVHVAAPAAVKTNPLSSPPFKPAPAPSSVAPSRSPLKVVTRFSHEEDDGEDGHDEGSDEEDDEAADHKRIAALRQEARSLEHNGDLRGAEDCLSRALELDPLDVRTLEAYAVFLQTRKGEVARADSFFTRALHVCLPDLLQSLTLKQKQSPPVPVQSRSPPNSLPKNPKEASSLRVRSVIRLLLTYANFLKRSKADIEAAATVYAKAVELGPEHAKALAAYAHFLCEEGGQQNVEDALGLFSRALKAEPHNVVHALWYAKLLRRCGKVAQAGIMYDVAHKFSNGTGRKIEATAICNLATFFYKQRKDPDKAQSLFLEGLARFPRHKGLVKNYSVLLKAVPTLRDNEERLKRASSSNSLASAASSSTPLSKAMKALLVNVNTASPVGTPKGNARAKTPVAISKPSTPIDVLAGTKTVVLPPPNSRDRDAADFAALFHPPVRDEEDEEEDEDEEDELYDAP